MLKKCKENGNEKEWQDMLVAFKKRVEEILDKYGLLNVLHKMRKLIQEYGFQSPQSSLMMTRLKVVMKIFEHSEERLYEYRKMVIKDARPFVDGPMEIEMPFHYDIKKVLSFVKDTRKWEDFFETIFSELVNDGIVTISEMNYFMVKVKEIADEEFKKAVDNEVLIDLEKYVAELKN